VKKLLIAVLFAAVSVEMLAAQDGQTAPATGSTASSSHHAKRHKQQHKSSHHQTKHQHASKSHPQTQ
jgi:Ni/Co efflux regulator RcnB